MKDFEVRGLVDMFVRCQRLWKDDNEALRWMLTPNVQLGGVRPCDDVYGATVVLDALESGAHT